MSSVKEYVEGLPEDRQVIIKKLQSLIKKNIPKGFEEQLSYGMIGYVVPHKIYPDGYHCDPKLPLPFLSIASQKNFIALYHMGMYAKPDLLDWFVSEYPKHCKSKLDMGKSCVRFKKMDDIPYALLEELIKKMTVADWISIYEKNYKK
jgi:hypothetical protein